MRILALTGSSSAGCFEGQLLGMALETNWDWVIQSSNFEPRRVTSKVRVESYLNLERFEDSADVLITHCGAGSVFWGLENKIPTIAIVNLSRPDDHQMDLGNYLDNKELCLVIRNRIPSKQEVLVAKNRGCADYQKIGVIDIVKLLHNVVNK